MWSKQKQLAIARETAAGPVRVLPLTQAQVDRGAIVEGIKLGIRVLVILGLVLFALFG